MEVIDWGGGLTEHEVKAIEKIKKTFQSTDMKYLKFFPWRGYSGFRFADAKTNKEGEFDLIIVTHCNVLIIELKNWNQGKIISKSNKWYLGNKDMGKSPVSVTRDKQFLLEKKLDKFKKQFTNKNRRPFVEFLIVMTGNADFSELPDDELKHIITLDELLLYKDIGKFNNKFRPHPDSQVLNKDFAIFDQLVNKDTVKPKSISINGYISENEASFCHPNEIYKEYLATSEQSKDDTALLRRWDFTKVDATEGKSVGGRFKLVSREYDVLQYLKVNNESLYRSCLNYKTVPQESNITADHVDLFELLPSHKRFNQFIAETVKNLESDKRIQLVKLLINKVAELHDADIAHRDLGAHSLWMSNNYQITLSGLATAFFPLKGTLGDIRDILSVSNNDFEKFFPMEGLTAYQIDVRALIILSLHLMQAERISPNSLKKIEKTDSNNWCVSFLLDSLKEISFKNAHELLDEFNSAAPKEVLDFSFDVALLDPFCQSINHARRFQQDDSDFYVEEEYKEVYLSNNQFVKVWLNVNKDDQDEARVIYKWLKDISRLQSISPTYIPKIREYGIATKSSSLFLVTDYIEQGYAWDDLIDIGLSSEQYLDIGKQLIHNIKHLHSLGLYHGDLHPDNIKVVIEGGLNIYLLDLLDFTSNGENKLNYEYSPDAAENAPENVRDNYAVMKMIMEIYESVDHDLSESAKKAFILENQDDKTGFISLERFEEIFNIQNNHKEITVIVRHDGYKPDLVIYPENDELFINIEKSRKGDDLHISFIGLGGSVSFIYSRKEERFIISLNPKEKDYLSRADKESILSLPVIIRIQFSDYQSCDDLNNILLVEYPQLKSSIANFICELDASEENINASNSMVNAIANTDSEEITFVDIELLPEKPLFVVKDLWKAILETETEALPYIKSNGDLVEIGNDPKKYVITYDGDSSPLDKFRKTDIVELQGINQKSEKPFSYGTVDLQASRLNEIVLKKTNKRTHSIKEDDVIFLQSKQSKSSFNRRENALSRILKEESIINNLVHYFDETCTLKPVDYNILVTDNEFARYDRKHNENIIKLNIAQREAFQKLINFGPLSLLQGPPGTGKTEFIAAFVHYLFEVQNVNNILLVSQSHEAVDTAAERIRRHCRRLNTPLEIVRFSNREGAVSTELQDVFSSNIISGKREALYAEKIERICILGSVLGLEETYLSKYAEIYFTIGVQVNRYHKLSSDLENLCKEERDLLKKIYEDIIQKARKIGLAFENNTDPIQIYNQLIEQINDDYSIMPSEANEAKKLIELTDEMLGALSNDRINYDEFLARSKQLVVGTCVGVGQNHIGVKENTYDWVIIDEAARSISSELAIAMQSGKRILLVGDQEQLPPLYSDEHKSALARKLGIAKKGEDLDQALGSDFARVFNSPYGKQTSSILKTQYRMAPAIGDLVSQCFYQGKLENGKTEEDVPAIYTTFPKNMNATVAWVDTSSLANSYHEQARNGSLSNRAEVDTVISLLENLQNNDLFMQSEVVRNCINDGSQAIGVICMYGEQKKLIRKRFNEKTWNEDFKELVKIDSVDSYQGKENRIIILSITRNDKKNSVGFLHLSNRINVALSRAMDRLYIVGASRLWEVPSNKKHPLGRVLAFIKSKINSDKKNYLIVKAEQKFQMARKGK